MDTAPAPPAYHERQRLQRCLQHSLNNLFQCPEFQGSELDGIADALAPGRLPLFGHPHRTMLLGNYDVNVLDAALRRRGKELHWHDLRDTTFAKLDLEGAWGLVLNVKGEGVVSRLTGGRHWLALRWLNGRWWNLDSQLSSPRLVADCCHEEADSGSSTDPAAAGEAAALKVMASRGAAAEGAAAATAEETPAAAEEAAVEAADAAAVRQFLSQQVQQRDAKVFRVVDSPLSSHPLPADEGTAAATVDA